MISATTQADYFEAYVAAYCNGKQRAEADWHPAWRRYHELYTRRIRGEPLVPSRDFLTSEPGAASHNLIGEDEQLAVNHIQTILRTILATTLNRDPEFSLDPEFEGFHAPAQATMAGCALNFTWRKEKFNNPTRESYVDSLLYGRGWVRFGWQSEFTRPISGQFGDDGTLPRSVIQDAADAVNELSRRGARLGRKPFTPDEVAQHMKTYGGKLLVEDKPTMRRVSPFNMFFDPMAETPLDARWIANRWLCPRDYAKNNTDWQPKARSVLGDIEVETATDPMMDNMGSDTQEYGGKDVVWVVDFFDLAEGTWCQFSEKGSTFLRKPTAIPFPFGQPFNWIENIDDPESPFPISEVEVVWPQQQTLTSIVQELGRDRQQSRPRVFVEKQMGEQIRTALESKDQGLVVEVDAPPSDGPITQHISTFKGESNAQVLMAQIGMTEQGIAQASGVSDYLTGGGGIGETATEINAKQVAAANFMGEKSARVRDFIEGNAQRVLMMMQVYSRLPFFVTTKAMDPAAGEVRDVTVSFDRSHMAGTFRVIVSADSTEEKTPQAKMAKAQAIVSTSIPFIQLGVVNPALLFKYVMKEGFGIDDPTELLTQAAYTQQPVDESQAPPTPSQQLTPAQPIGGISMTPGSMAGQLGASVAADRTTTGATVPST